MQGDAKITAALNGLLADENTASDFYFCAARFIKCWGYKKLAHKLMKESREEKHHAENLLDQLLFLEAQPDGKARNDFEYPADVPGFFRTALAMEVQGVEHYEKAMALCHERGDFLTLGVLHWILGEEHDHLDWLQKQLKKLVQMGVQNFLQEWV